MEDDLDLILGDEELALGGDWFCEACEYGPMDEEEGRCGRCITSINITKTKRWNWMRMVILWMKNIMKNIIKD